MIKAMMPIALMIVLVAVLPLGCGTTGLGNIGNIVTEEKKAADFSKLEITGTFEFEIVRSDSFSVRVSADASMFDYIAVDQEGQTLKLYLNPRHTLTEFLSLGKTFKAKITMPTLNSLHLAGATKGTVTGFKSSSFNIDVSGANSLEMKNMELGSAEFTVSGASKVSGKMKAEEIKLKVSGVSEVELAGLANNLVLSALGASKLNLSNFPVAKAKVDLSGASEATVSVKERLEPILSDASRLYFRGNPIVENISLSGASTIKQR